MTLEELNTLLDFLREHRPQRFSEYKPYYALVFFLSRTGLRISEALALRWSDLQSHRVNIDQQTSRDNNNNASITSLKTPASYRNIKIDEDTIEMLHSFKKVQNQCIQKHDKFIRHPDVTIFQTYNGNSSCDILSISMLALTGILDEAIEVHLSLSPTNFITP